MEHTFTVTADHGLHARPAAALVQIATPYASDVQLIADGRAVNLKSIMAVMGLGLAHGATFTVRADGPDADAVLGALSTHLQQQGLAQRA
ncbi:HPr family phosphocarrier protein [Deinococcus maricopensis]|uniref:Phosphotransferase system, phosphocarrier protein HPr n=1 Tax=Deinococcus maricopensis (strain DSM 21211 / LMG 22137 / NRRL B-23946 / LB-34) TaxID=709986 RepID=E8U562_DEIML|nr:HPr family phosphocarrier protein [Deinococcus maricopensis]ADV66201.1 Phosphotransferase system, phosphocarrier protein HPr [Deinococcus maricopensis DSM 21211]